MAKKILNIFTENLPFKILALGLAFVLWLVVYNIDDPNITQTFTTKVTIENAATVTEENKCYQVLDNTNIVSFSVTAKRSILKNLGSSDFRATADLHQMILSEGGTIGSVPIEIVSSRMNSDLSYSKSKFLKLSLEDLSVKRLSVIPATSGEVAEGYALGEVSVENPTRIKVSGPKSIVDTIEKAVATIDVDGVTSLVSDNIIPQLYDKDGNEINSPRLSLSNETVTVKAKILVTKDLSLNVSFVGMPESGYKVIGVTNTPLTVRVKGTASTVNPLTELAIPAELIDISGAEADINTTIDITELLPDGVSLVNAMDGKVAVTVTVEQFRTLKYMMRSEQISIEGVEEGYEAKLASAYVSVSISGLQKDLNLLDVGTMTGHVDVTGRTSGVHSVNVLLDLDTELYEIADITVNVAIEKIGGEDTEVDTEAGTESQGQEENNTQDSAEPSREADERSDQ